MATLKEIEEAIQSIEARKQSLKEAFDDLQKYSHSLSSFSLSWLEIDSHFSHIQSSLQSRLSFLQEKERLFPESKQYPVLQTPPNPEIRVMCEKMEAVKLRDWVKASFKLNDGNLSELGQALKCAPNPFKLVLEAIEGLRPKGKTAVVLLEALMMIEGVNVGGEMRERAKSLALEWKGEVNKEGKYPLEVVGFLSLLGCFGLVEDIGKDDVLDLVYVGAKNARIVTLCRVIGLEDKVPDLVQKLVKCGRALLAIKFVYEFKLADKFPPVKLLKSYLMDAKKSAQQLRKKGKNLPKSMGLADEKELNALKTVLKYIRDYNLASEYSPETIEKRIKQLEELKAKRKTAVPTQPKPNQQKTKKVPKKMVQKSKQLVTRENLVSAPVPGISNSVGVNSLPSSQQAYLRPPLMSMELPGSGSSAGSYAMSGSISNALYGLASSLLSYANNPSSAGSHPNTLGLQLPSSSYGALNPLEGYGIPPQYHPAYYPQ